MTTEIPQARLLEVIEGDDSTHKSSESETATNSDPKSANLAPTQVGNDDATSDSPSNSTQAHGTEEAIPEITDFDERSWQREFKACRDRDIMFFVIAVIALLVAYTAQPTPANDGLTIYGLRMPETCFTKDRFNLDCPGCGLTRSVVMSANLDSQSWTLHRLGPLFFLIFWFQIPYRLLRLRRYRRIREAKIVDADFIAESPWVYWFKRALLAALALNWIWNIAMSQQTP